MYITIYNHLPLILVFISKVTTFAVLQVKHLRNTLLIPYSFGAKKAMSSPSGEIVTCEYLGSSKNVSLEISSPNDVMR